MTPVVSGSPVRFVATPEVGVPSNGVTRVGEVASTTEPDPVVAVAESTPDVRVAIPVPVERLPVLPPVPENRTISLSTDVDVLVEKSPLPDPLVY